MLEWLERTDLQNDLSRVVDALPGLVWTALPDGSIDFLNQRWCEYTGISAEEALGRGWQAAVHPDDLHLLLERWPSDMAGGKRGEMEARLRGLDGTFRWFLFRTFPLLDAAGEIEKWCGMNTDIDDRRRAEKDLRAIETNYSDFVEGFPGLIVTMNMTGKVELFSNEVLEFFGKTRDELRDWQMTDAVHPDDLPRVIPAFTESVMTGKPYSIEHRCRRADGVYRWFQVRALAVRNDAGETTGWYVVLVDIDDLKRAESAMRENERHLTDTINTLHRSRTFLLEVQRVSHTGGWRFDVASDTVESSGEIQRFYDPQPDEDISRPAFWFDRIHPEDRQRVEAEFQRCLRDRNEYQAGYRILLPNGNIRYQYATGHPIVDEGGNLVEFIGASMDMTEHWLATKDLERASDALRELQTTMSRAAQVATVGEFAASMAHEVNQPLSGIITNANTCLRMLASDPPNVDGARETARRTIRDGNRASDVITRLRALFAKKEFALEPLDLNEATLEVIALSSSELQRNRVFVQSDLAENLPPIRGDRVQIQQVILNLLRNASDAMTTVHDRRRELIIRTDLENDDYVRLAVADVGVGIESQNLDKLFAPFYTTKTDGMGIGLSVSRSIIESHHGRLWAAPNQGPGATFAFSIPRSSEDETRTSSIGDARAPAATDAAPVMRSL